MLWQKSRIPTTLSSTNLHLARPRVHVPSCRRHHHNIVRSERATNLIQPFMPYTMKSEGRPLCRTVVFCIYSNVNIYIVYTVKFSWNPSHAKILLVSHQLATINKLEWNFWHNQKTQQHLRHEPKFIRMKWNEVCLWWRGNVKRTLKCVGQIEIDIIYLLFIYLIELGDRVQCSCKNKWRNGRASYFECRLIICMCCSLSFGCSGRYLWHHSSPKTF